MTNKMEVTLPVIDTFNAVEQLEEAHTSLGWEVQYRQLSQGDFEYRALSKESSAGISLIREQLNLKVETLSGGHPNLRPFLIPAKGENIWCNGYSVNDNKFIMLAPEQPAHIITHGATDALSLFIKANILSEFSSKLTLLPDKSLMESSALVQISHEKMHLLKQMADSILYPATDNLHTGEIALRFIEYIALLLNDNSPSLKKTQGIRTVEKLRVLYRSREYIEAHLDQPIKMAELCHYSSISLSKLERVFHSELQMPPLAYIKVRRLNKIRSRLIGNTSLGKTISQLAMDHGFTHLGRFSAEYYALFGQLPREDRKS
ncbi:MAG: helix-turn-helix domain-containing protein [Methyloprofundus sp.]|nr:helix-turn-helix domain-containing protein [Methyloprofundus sp.]